MTLTFIETEKKELTPRITVFGVGGAGGNAVNNMIDQQLAGVEFVVANTDAQALQQSRAPARIQLGIRATEGLGAGARPQVGAIAAEEALARFEEGRSWTLLVDHDAGPTLQTAARSLERAARNGGVSNVRVHVLDPAEADEHTGLRPGLIESLAGSDSAGQVLISLGFFPPENAQPPLPRMVVILPSTDQGADFLAAGTVDMVIEPAFADPESGLTRRDSPRRWFDSYFRIRTGES